MPGFSLDDFLEDETKKKPVKKIVKHKDDKKQEGKERDEDNKKKQVTSTVTGKLREREGGEGTSERVKDAEKQVVMGSSQVSDESGSGSGSEKKRNSASGSLTGSEDAKGKRPVKKKLRVIRKKKQKPKELENGYQPPVVIRPSAEEVMEALKELEQLRQIQAGTRIQAIEELYGQFESEELRRVYEEAIRSIPGYQGRLMYLKDFVFPEKGVLNPSEISLLLSISLGEAIVLLRDYLEEQEKSASSQGG